MTLIGSSRRVLTLGAVAALAASVMAATPAPPAAGAAGSGGSTPIYLQTRYSFAERAADLVSRMTLPEKVAQLHTNSAPAIPRLGVQSYTYWSEGQHGINLLGADSNNGGAAGGPHATSFPTNLSSTMSWDPALVYQETTAISDEVRGELDKSLWGVAQNNIGPSADDYGSLTYWAPTVNMDRDPRWGRTDEAFGEDPYLVGKMAGAFVAGYQGETIDGTPTSPYLKVAATAKHFALNNNENDRHADSADASESDIRDYYTAQFRSLVEDSHVAGLMTSYNAINGTPSPADTYTTDALAQRTWGFDGYITSDCGAVGDVTASSSHDWAPPGWTVSVVNGTSTWTNTATGVQVPADAGGQAYALRAGTDANCTGGDATLGNIEAAIKAEILSEGVIDHALVQLFTVRMQTGEFDPANKVAYTRITKAQIQSPEHQALAEKVAANSLVLLKNDPMPGSAAKVLPANPASLNNVVVVGDLANTVTLGGYSGDPTLQVNAVQGITSAVKAANPNATVTFDACGTSTTATAAASCSAATQAAIKTADLVVVFVGTDGSTAGESNDRASLAMPGNYDSLISQVAALGNPRTVLSMQTDGPVDIENVKGDFPAIVYSAYNGESQGTALADVLFGKQNPSGHLDFTWYKDDSQLPSIKNYGLNPADTGGLGRTYQYFTGTPTYPFGYGLSYTDFAYSKVQATDHADAQGKATVRFDVTNTGKTPGATVAQLYITPPSVPGTQQPAEQLEGFAKTAVLKPGQTQHLSVSVNIADLATWDAQNAKNAVTDGTYTLRLATDAADTVASRPLRVTGAIKPRIQYVTVQPDQVVFTPGNTLDLTGKNPWIADDTAQAAQHPSADSVVEAVNNDESFADLSSEHVKYSSSDPAVASVSRTGVVTTHAVGTATIRVSVDGVTGSTPIAVHEPFAMSAPAVAVPGGSFTVTTTSANPSGGEKLRNAAFHLTVPAGWTATASTPATFPSVAAGQTITTTWTVGVPADASPTADAPALTAQYTFTDGTGTHSDTTGATVSIPYSSIAAASTNPGVSDDSDTAVGNLDGGGASYSAQTLATATPSITPGGTFTHDGLTFTWPAPAPGTPDNIVATGQTIPVTGTGSTLGIVGTADYGAASGTAVITYTDGTTQSFSLAYSDWWTNAAASGGDVLATFPYLNNASGALHNQVSLYTDTVPLTPGKTIKYLTLPNVGTALINQTAMHIFAIAVG
ncbi:glycoside hydrolase family 3 domain protein [Catenulispora acidiphila DSM 44928]|uniref:Glycoside hydrolase family 3 domain protein n=1 Tax=Catenulispora acidiphila (strain DSM 44928 / JCM 14897 / NBRC 102108 / NRRL B-24433 / ID139908) TaxID=479433 RepID=C7Q1L4_CATAD|nr:glycoside hydrolase family 3 C-terminal domain-containing protein [Catenulispora acidiphila]ACU73743.1 glycoside hydrolase family 3 domain protein [Catenulispora acidiphila DSM 44928]